MGQPCGPGWALVGDAGYFKDPITAHGITDALRDAELLARAVADVLGGDVPEARRMRAYRCARNRLSTQLFSVTEQIAAYAWDVTTIEGLLRTLSSAMGDEVDYLMALDSGAMASR
jgi:flavin-dependent dehydrogenase